MRVAKKQAREGELSSKGPAFQTVGEECWYPFQAGMGMELRSERWGYRSRGRWCPA